MIIDKETTSGKQFRRHLDKVEVTSEMKQANVYTLFKDGGSEGLKFTKDELLELQSLIDAVLVDGSFMSEAAKDHARAGRKIDAIKVVRDVSELHGERLGLREAKDLVEEWMRDNILVATNTNDEFWKRQEAWANESHDPKNW